MTSQTTARPPLSTDAAAELRFRTMEQAFSRHGGLMKADDLLDALRRRMSQPLSWIARRIASREMLSFPWRHALWIPRFQFVDEASLEIRPAVAQVVRTMTDRRDDWELVSWFVEDNEHLDGLRPIDLLETLAEAVTGAAAQPQAEIPR